MEKSSELNAKKVLAKAKDVINEKDNLVQMLSDKLAEVTKLAEAQQVIIENLISNIEEPRRGDPWPLGWIS